MQIEKVNEINSIFKSYKILAHCTDYNEINNYYYYDIRLEPRARIKDIEKFSSEIGLALKSYAKPSINLLSELGILRLEFFRNFQQNINLFQYFDQYIPPGELSCLLGEGIQGNKVWVDLAKAPHMLVAGTTGSGKSTILHSIIANLLLYHNAKICIMDPKNMEFSQYAECIKKDMYVMSTYNSCLLMLDKLCSIMESRYELLRQKNNSYLQPMVIIIDEFSDLILQDKDNEFYTKLCKLSQKCRAAKMHIILATQRPSVDVISGVIKANFPVRISCKVASGIDSKVVLDTVGAERLFGKGDSFLKNNVGKLERFQAAFTSSEEICNFFK